MTRGIMYLVCFIVLSRKADFWVSRNANSADRVGRRLTNQLRSRRSNIRLNRWLDGAGNSQQTTVRPPLRTWPIVNTTASTRPNNRRTSFGGFGGNSQLTTTVRPPLGTLPILNSMAPTRRLNNRRPSFGGFSRRRLGISSENCEFRCQTFGKCISAIFKCHIDFHGDEGCPRANIGQDCGNNKYCPPNKFRCNTGHCIELSRWCDASNDCPDGSDEVGCENSTCQDSRNYQCSSGHCVSFLFRCNTKIECPDQSDEIGCDCDASNGIKCKSNRRGEGNCSLASSRFCDGTKDCIADYDETVYSKTKLKIRSEFPCQSTSENVNEKVCKLEMKYVCDGQQHCRYNADECFYVFHSTCFRCLDNSRVIPRDQVCNGKFDCGDLSDEYLCQNTSSWLTLCRNSSFPEAQLGVLCTKDNSSEETCCHVCEETLTRPLDYEATHCPIKNTVYRNILSRVYSGEKLEQMLCCNNKDECLDKEKNWKCSYMARCTDVFAYTNYVFKCDGVVSCDSGSDEFCDKDSRFENHTRMIQRGTQDRHLMCNGIRGDYANGDEDICPHRTYCNDTSVDPVNVRSDQICDGVADCYDQSDEKIETRNCSENFYCKAGNLNFINKSKSCDDRDDCDNGEDEVCNGCIVSPFSSEEKLISHPAALVFLVLSGILAFGGNIIHVVTLLRRLYYERKKLSDVAKINSFHIISLALSDFLVGVYILGIVIANEKMSGTYCREDKPWRTSVSCLALGTIALLGSECSVMSLLLLTLQRLYTVIYPFKYPSVYKAALRISAMWITVIIITVMPILSSLNHYFVSKVQYTTNPFLTTVDLKENNQIIANFFMAKEKLDFKANAIVMNSWDKVNKVMAEIDPKIKPRYIYHYYSKHGVCLPNYYPKPREDPSFMFSTAIITVNAICFIVMVVSYSIIYYRKYTLTKATQREMRPSLKEDKQLATMQRKILWITLTDFCCWMPICIALFISLANIRMPSDFYAATAIAILPINSVINPFIYSDIIPWATNFCVTLKHRLNKKQERDSNIQVELQATGNTVIKT